MLKTARILLAGAMLAAMSNSARADEGDGPRQAGHFSAALFGGFGMGFEQSGVGAAIAPFEPALGLRAGYTLPQGWYLGAQALGFGTANGSTVSQSLQPGASRRWFSSVLAVGAEAGYDVAVSGMIVRPSVGLGYGDMRYASVGAVTCGGSCAPGKSAHDGALYAAPGLALLAPLGPLTLGIEPRLFLLFGEASERAFTGLASVGLDL